MTTFVGLGLLVLLMVIANACRQCVGDKYDFRHMFRHSSNGTSLTLKNDAASKKAIQCCASKAGLSLTCAKAVCHYFGEKNYPDNCTVPIMHNFNKMVACFAAHKDNRKCCKHKGVKAPCLDLCNGKNPDYLPDPAYVPCTLPGKVDTAIQKCNHDAWKLGTDQ